MRADIEQQASELETGRQQLEEHGRKVAQVGTSYIPDCSDYSRYFC